MQARPTILAGALVLTLPVMAGCTRTYDGSIVPAYETVMVSDGGATRMELRPTDPGPPDRFYRFPDQPQSSAYADASQQAAPPARNTRRAHRRSAGRQVPETGEARRLRCQPAIQADGRYRMECL